MTARRRFLQTLAAIPPALSMRRGRAAAAVAPVIELKAGGQAPQLLQPSLSPYSAGFYPLGRKFTVGDRATFRESDLLTGVGRRIYTERVTRVDHEADRVEINRGKVIWDLMGNVIKVGDIKYDAPVQFTPAEFQLGKKWKAAFIRIENGRSLNAYYDLRIVRRGKVSVPAGTFEAFRIEGEGWSKNIQLEVRLWLVPGLNFPVKLEKVTRNRGRLIETKRHELISLRQQAIGT
jgi:hypothetical protein